MEKLRSLQKLLDDVTTSPYFDSADEEAVKNELTAAFNEMSHQDAKKWLAESLKMRLDCLKRHETAFETSPGLRSHFLKAQKKLACTLTHM